MKTDPALQGLLSTLISTSGSGFGFIAEIRTPELSVPVLEAHAVANLSWSEDIRRFYADRVRGATAAGDVIRCEGAALGRLPAGHPPVRSLLVCPLQSGSQVVGLLVLGNPPNADDRSLLASLAPLLSIGGELLGARRQARQASEAEARHRAVLDSVLDAVITIDENDVIESVNPAAERMFGYAPGELVGRNVSVLMPEPHRSRHDDYVRRYQETGTARVIGIGREVEGQRRDGSLFPVELAVTPVDIGGARYFTGILRDITERKRAEDRLLVTTAAVVASEDRTRRVIDTALDAVISMDAAGCITEWNVQAERIFGWSRQEAIGRSLVETIVPPALRERHRRGLDHYLATGEGPVLNRRVEITALRRNGEEFPVELAIAPVGTRPTATFSGFVRDITDRRRAEQALRASEERYRLLVEHSLQGIYIHTEGVVRLANPALVAMLGYVDASELVGRPYWLILAPEERARIESYRQARLRDGETSSHREPPPRVYEAQIVRKDGAPLWVENCVTVIPWEDGQAVMVTFLDITERKRAEAALQASEERLALATLGADLGVWDWEVSTGVVSFSPQWCAMLGHEPSEITPDLTSWEHRLHPDDAREAKEAMRAHLDNRSPAFRHEHRLRTKAGAWKWVLAHGKAVARGPDGRALRVVGIQADITARKTAELALETALGEIRRSQENLITVLNQLRLAVVVTDADGTIVFLSQQCASIDGIDADGAIGRSWEDVFPLDELSRERLRAMMTAPPAARDRLTLGMRTAAGRTYHLECDIDRDPRDASRRIIYLYDVTEIYELRARVEVARHGEMVGASPAMRRLFEQVQQIAPGDWTVLIEGETGVGKELVARALHAASPRRHGPFIAVNCAGLTESLLVSQLFGHRKGAFTGATADRQGFFEAAEGGTIFLDEIGDLPAAMQTSLLRVLQEREITRLGDARPRKVNVRVLTATHRDLAGLVAAGQFREDLLYRVRVARLAVPPLRKRAGDIPLLVAAFLAESRLSAGKTVARIGAHAMRVLEKYPWPGNVRELRHAIEHAVIHCQGGVIDATDLPPEILSPREPKRASEPPTSRPAGDEKARLRTALAQARGNRKRAAELLGISRATFYRRLKELDLDVPS